ncbi:Uncharacterised protein [Shigella sonnei]|nr:Uncharacterised protein [Shigella sonnei]
MNTHISVSTDTPPDRLARHKLESMPCPGAKATVKDCKGNPTATMATSQRTTAHPHPLILRQSCGCQACN